MFDIPQAEVDAAVAELDKVREAWLKRPGVTGVDVGLAFKDGVMTDQLAIRVYVRRKQSLDELAEGEAFPEQLGRFAVDVIQSTPGPQAAGATGEGLPPEGG